MIHWHFISSLDFKDKLFLLEWTGKRKKHIQTICRSEWMWWEEERKSFIFHVKTHVDMSFFRLSTFHFPSSDFFFDKIAFGCCSWLSCLLELFTVYFSLQSLLLLLSSSWRKSSTTQNERERVCWSWDLLFITQLLLSLACFLLLLGLIFLIHLGCE